MFTEWLKTAEKSERCCFLKALVVALFFLFVCGGVFVVVVVSVSLGCFVSEGRQLGNLRRASRVQPLRRKKLSSRCVSSSRSLPGNSQRPNKTTSHDS